MTHDELVDAAASAIFLVVLDGMSGDFSMLCEENKESFRTQALAVISMALEEAAKIAEDKANRLSQYRDVHSMLQVATAEDIADEIRQLKGDK